jgi:hypothetical protein
MADVMNIGKNLSRGALCPSMSAVVELLHLYDKRGLYRGEFNVIFRRICTITVTPQESYYHMKCL